MQKPKPPIFPNNYQLDKTVQDWLCSEGSLTKKIERFSGQKMLVKPSFEGRKTLSLAEKGWLNLPKNRPQSAWVREVLLFGKTEEPAWVSAKSVFAFDGLTGQARKLCNLGERPVGYMIFRRNKAVLQSRRYHVSDFGVERCSLYRWQGARILICERFLPTLLGHLAGCDID